MSEKLRNFIDGAWVEATTDRYAPVINPATEETLAEVPLGGAADIDKAARAAHEAFASWRSVPPVERARYLFKLKQLLEDNREELAATVTREHGKTIAESRGSVQRGIECVEVACGAPSLLMGDTLEDVAKGIDCQSVRQPLGVFAVIAPFNFPAMVPMWFFPFAVACGNTFICKPSEQVPLSQQLIWKLVEDCGFPSGVLNMVHGDKEVVDAILTHALIRGVSFVGSSPIAKYVYETAAAHGKRVQALGGAKNFMVVMPDADREMTLDALSSSAYGCAGERCLAGAIVLAVGDSHEWVRDGLRERAAAIRVGDGSEAGVTMGPVISAKHKAKVLGYIDKGVEEGASLVHDGRGSQQPDTGYFVGPCLFDGVTEDMVIGQEEIFGPVLCIEKAADLDAAMRRISAHPLANASTIFTQDGRAARKFKFEVDASMAAVNIGVAAPMSFFGFGGAKGSFFGDLKAHGKEAFDFFTDRKVFMTRWG